MQETNFFVLKKKNLKCEIHKKTLKRYLLYNYAKTK